MEGFSLSTTHFSIPTNTNTTLPPFSSSTLFSTKHNPSSAISFHLKPLADSNNSSNFRRPSKPLKTTPLPNKSPSNSNPLNPSHSLTNKLWLTSKLSPPPPPPPAPVPLPPLPLELDRESEFQEENGETGENSVNSSAPATQFRQQGKIFVGNLPGWVKKHNVAEFFRQFGPIKNVILIKSHHHTERNAGFGFVIYDGDTETAEKSAIKAVEFDGVEFHGRVLTVKLDDGKRLREKSQERVRWLEGSDHKEEYQSKWHEERDGSRKEFRKVLETEPENWQAVVRSFERIKKVWTS